MLPEFIPYLIKRESYVDPITGESLRWSRDFEKEYRLYHVPTKKLLKKAVNRAYFVDESLVSSTAIVLEQKDDENQNKYTIINTIDDLNSLLWFDYLQVITPQLIIVRKDKKYGVVNDRMQMKCFFEYDSLDEYISSDDHRVFIIANKDGRYGLLNEDLSIKFSFNYDSITCNGDLGIFVLQSNDSTLVYDIEDNSISKFPFIAHTIKDISEGCIVVENHRKYCVYDKDAQRFLCDRWFDDIDSVQNGFSLCDHKYILERTGRIIEMEGARWFDRSGVIVYSTTHIQGDEWLIRVYKKNQFLYEFRHDKGSYGIFYCRVVDGKYVEVGSFSDKYSMHTPQAVHDLMGNSVPLSVITRNEITKSHSAKLANIYHTSGFRAKPTKHYKLENADEFEDKYFSKSKYLTHSDNFDLIELEPNLLKLETMSVDDGRCYWYLVGYIYNDIKLWADIRISND